MVHLNKNLLFRIKANLLHTVQARSLTITALGTIGFFSDELFFGMWQLLPQLVDSIRVDCWWYCLYHTAVKMQVTATRHTCVIYCIEFGTFQTFTQTCKKNKFTHKNMPSHEKNVVKLINVKNINIVNILCKYHTA